jgi:CelD/BcsL family acetyltransferase involved in cellulose biosynthesis
VKITSVRPSELGPAELARWGALQDADPELADPYFSAGWALLVDSVRSDARVAVFEDSAGIQAFLPVQKRSGFTAMAIGAPMCDYQGLIAAPGLDVDLRDAAAAIGVERIDFAHAPASQRAFVPFIRSIEEVRGADLSRGYAAFIADLKAAGSSSPKNVGSRRRKAERELGPVETRAFAPDPVGLETMISWKREQMKRTRQPDLFAVEWVDRMVRRIAEGPVHDLEPAFVTVRIADRIVATHLGLRRGQAMHNWLIAHDISLNAYSPGVLMWFDQLEKAAALGITEVDYGCGEYAYKKLSSNRTRRVGHGFIGRPGIASAFRSLQFTLRGVIERAPAEAIAALPGKAMRRVDFYRGLAAPTR